MQQIENTTSSAAQRPANLKLLVKVSWFIRFCAVSVLGIAVVGLVRNGWPHNLKACGSLQSLFGGTMLMVMSFLYVTSGRTKLILAVATIILGASIMIFSLAMLIVPHL